MADPGANLRCRHDKLRQASTPLLDLKFWALIDVASKLRRSISNPLLQPRYQASGGSCRRYSKQHDRPSHLIRHHQDGLVSPALR